MAFYVTQDEQLITDRPVDTRAQREDLWERLSPVTKELFILLYGSPDDFLDPKITSPLEQYIIYYDEFMADEGLIRQLAFRIGAEISRNVDAAVFFYWVMRQVISVFGLAGQAGNNIPSLRDIINMTRPEYHNWRHDEDVLQTDDTYHQRLLIVLDEARIGK